MSIFMTASASTAQTGFEGAHQIPSNDLPSFYYPPYFSGEYAPVRDPETGIWYPNPMGMSGEDHNELLQCGPGFYQSTLDDVLIEQRYEERIVKESMELDEEAEGGANDSTDEEEE